MRMLTFEITSLPVSQEVAVMARKHRGKYLQIERIVLVKVSKTVGMLLKPKMK